MSTQASPLPAPPEFQNQIQNHRSLLDEPWKVTLIPAGAPVGEDPHAAKSLPWHVGDVTRLKDDSPKGMMEYIATHSTGWWREMAERALRDTEKAERMAREAGWEYGQYWALEVDAEAKQKLLEAEEAKRVREEAERAKEEAEKQAFIQRQMELLERAGRAPRCEYQYADGRGCKSPQVTGERWCHGHAKMMSYRPEKLEILPMEDEQAVMVNLYRVTNSLLAGRISEKTAALLLWSAAMVAPGLNRAKSKTKTYHGDTEARRKARRGLPRISADARGSERKVGRESRHAGTGSTRTNTNQQQRCASRNLDGSHPAKPTAGLSGTPGSTPRNTPPQQAKSGLVGGPGTGASLTMTSRSAAKSARRGVINSGVGHDKSFVSGVAPGVSPKDRRHCASLVEEGFPAQSKYCEEGSGRQLA
ncbi:MAG TPA: hypothetical protein VFW31_02115 [Candidatus Angelobacter sp.]|nr:hypothetical protein [Candidatus Angelobacter sp.]